MSDDKVINLRDYLFDDEASPLQYFSVWGGEGEHSRFSLPLWRAIYIAVGERAGLVWTPAGERRASRLEPHYVLDLASDRARLDFPAPLVSALAGERAPAFADRGIGGLAILLGEQDDRRWYLVVDNVSEKRGPLDRQGREDLLFLAGEAAGLLFHRGLSAQPPPPKIDRGPEDRETDILQMDRFGLGAGEDEDPWDDDPWDGEPTGPRLV